jgi:hypothetical protein
MPAQFQVQASGLILPIRDLFILDFEEAKKTDQHAQQELLSSCCSLYSGYIVQQQVNAAQQNINQHGTRDDAAIAELVDGNAKYQCNLIVVESMQVECHQTCNCVTV